MPIPPPDNYPDDSEQHAIVHGLVRMVSSETGGSLHMLEPLQSLPGAIGLQVGRLLLLLGSVAVSDRATWMAMLDKARDQVEALREICRQAQEYEPPSAAELQVIKAREVALNAIVAEHKLVSIWSYGEDVDMDAPHPYPQATIVVHETISGVVANGVRCWGGEGGRFEAPILGNRWLDLWVAADAAIQASGDLHHRCIEYFKAGTDPAELHLGTGS